MPSAVVILPTGAEEMEFVGSVDVLRRAGVSLNCKVRKSLGNPYLIHCLSLFRSLSLSAVWMEPNQ